MEKPSRIERASEGECSKSSQSSPSGSLKTVAASSKGTLCFFVLPRALWAYQEEHITVYTLISGWRQGAKTNGEKGNSRRCAEQTKTGRGGRRRGPARWRGRATRLARSGRGRLGRGS